MNSGNRGNYSSNFSPQFSSSPYGRFSSPAAAFPNYSPRPNYSKNNSPYGASGKDHSFNNSQCSPMIPWSSSPNYSPRGHFTPRSGSSFYQVKLLVSVLTNSNKCSSTAKQ